MEHMRAHKIICMNHLYYDFNNDSYEFWMSNNMRKNGFKIIPKITVKILKIKKVLILIVVILILNTVKRKTMNRFFLEK